MPNKSSFLLESAWEGIVRVLWDLRRKVSETVCEEINMCWHCKYDRFLALSTVILALYLKPYVFIEIAYISTPLFCYACLSLYFTYYSTQQVYLCCH